MTLKRYFEFGKSNALRIGLLLVLWLASRIQTEDLQGWENLAGRLPFAHNHIRSFTNAMIQEKDLQGWENLAGRLLFAHYHIR